MSEPATGARDRGRANEQSPGRVDAGAGDRGAPRPGGRRDWGRVARPPSDDAAGGVGAARS